MRNGADAVPKAAEVLVDREGLLSPFTSGLRLEDSLAASEVDKVESAFLFLSSVPDLQLVDAVASRRVFVQHRRSYGPVLVRIGE